MDKPAVETLGLRVVTLQEGRLCGFVRRVYFYAHKRAISGFAIREPHAGESEGWIDASGVRRVGEHVLFVERAEQIKAKSPLGRDLMDAIGTPVTALDGRFLGSLVDVGVSGWRISRLFFADGRALRIRPADAVFGRDAVLVPARLIPEPAPSGGLLAALFGAAATGDVRRAVARVELAAHRHLCRAPERPRNR
jgi:hypothetical protein